MAFADPALLTVRAVFPHTALQSVVSSSRLGQQLDSIVDIQMGANRQIVIDIDVSGSPQAEGRSQSG
jgi:hypothetical protein